MTPREQAHFRLMTLVQENPTISQQELAERLGISAGKAHYLIHALIDKGLLKMENFRKGDGKLQKVAYLLTPAGLRHRMGLTRAYLARKEQEYQQLTEELDALRQELTASGDAV